MGQTDYEIFKERGLFGLKEGGKILIPPSYYEFYPFRYGLACVRNKSLQYSYINVFNEPLFHFGKYLWVDTGFIAGYARVRLKDNLHWSIIDLSGKQIVNDNFTNILSLDSGFLPWVKAYINEWEFMLDLNKVRPVLIGLSYLKTYQVDEFKSEYGIDRIQVKRDKESNLFFTYGANIGEVATKSVPASPVISIVKNCLGKVFLLLHDKVDLDKADYKSSNHNLTKLDKGSHHHSSMSYTEYQDYVEESYLDAFEGDESNYWNID